MIPNKTCNDKFIPLILIINFFRKVWIDLPPSATAPVYKEKVYVKALRMPKETELKFKNDDYFSKKKTEVKPKNVDLFASSKDESSSDAAKFNSASSGKAGQTATNKSNSFEDKNANKGNDLHNLINGGSTKAETENKKVNKEDNSNDLEFTFPNRKFIFKFLISLILHSIILQANFLKIS